MEGCTHSIFEIISNSLDEARDGYGDRINVTLYPDHSVEVEDFGRGIPVDYNKAEQRWNWDLVFCELYAGGKYGEGDGTYDFSLGLNGLGPVRHPVCQRLDDRRHLPRRVPLSS